MKMRIHSKILITIYSLVVLSLIVQMVFNQFYLKKHFIYHQKSIIADAYEQIKENYNDDLECVDEIAVEILDSHGIKTVILKNGESVYSLGYSYDKKGNVRNIRRIIGNAEFTTDPVVNIREGNAARGETDRLQLAGTFYHGGEKVNVLLTLQISAIDNSISVFTKSNVYISVVELVIGFLIAFVVSKTISAPIINIKSVSEKIAGLDFSAVADENDSTIELASLAQSVNQMSQQLNQNMCELTTANEQLQRDIELKNKIETYRRDFVASVSHEMKTPLALLQIYAENLKNNIQGIDRAYYCETILEEVDKLHKMVSNMLEMSSIDSGFIILVSEEMDLTQLCRDILREYEPVLSSYQTNIQLSDNIFILGDIKYLEWVIKNILNNAVQHTDAGGEIQVTLQKIENKVHFEVFNQGKHIPEEDLQHLWDAFYRTDKARTCNGENNVGLGLYIVKTIIDKSRGECSIENRDHGVVVTVVLDCK
ncbi:MAG: HAMP domain-containing histidine kinase [Agathobacter sp.]|nr:HAMP domain-containing histidine kinase [Agathobacter sp.]